MVRRMQVVEATTVNAGITFQYTTFRVTQATFYLEMILLYPKIMLPGAG